MATMNKRKRASNDLPNPRAAPGMGAADFDQSYMHPDHDAIDHSDNNIDFATALAQHNADLDTGESHDLDHVNHRNNPNGNSVQSASDTAAAAIAHFHTMTVPQSTEQSFMTGGDSDDRPQSSSMDQANGQHRASESFGDFDISSLGKDGQATTNGDTSPTLTAGQSAIAPKPQVGTEEWHKVRRDNHKEVERRRRETINEGINELAKIVPGCEKNKGSILARAVQFITQLKENESQNIEKWTLEKLLTEQAIAELSSSCDKLKNECQRAWQECEQWKKAAQKAGLSIDQDAKPAAADVDDAE